MKSRIQSVVRPFALTLVAAIFQGSAAAQGPGGPGGAPPAGPQQNFTQPVGHQISPPPCLTLHGLGGFTPCTPTSYTQWLESIVHWRMEERIRIGYDDGRYGNPALKWAQSAFMQPQMMVHVRYFYDPVAGKYTVDRYLEDLQKRYGGIDAVLIWAVYPNAGIDDRNQLDMVRSMPGGVEGVRKMVEDFHRRGVRVLFPMMMWDQGTRDPNEPWPDAIAELMKSIDADGINGDTQQGVPLAFSLAAEKIGHPLAFEPEGSPADEGLAWNVLTWGQYGPNTFECAPSVDRFRWLDPRHQVNIQGRWLRDKTDDLQYAFFNGEGWESWENVWGIWNGVTPRDAEATRRVATMERAVAPFLVSQDWQPWFPMHRYGVFASRWPLNDQTVWTIVNLNEYDVDGAQMTVPHREGVRYHGVPAAEGTSSTSAATPLVAFVTLYRNQTIAFDSALVAGAPVPGSRLGVAPLRFNIAARRPGSWKVRLPGYRARTCKATRCILGNPDRIGELGRSHWQPPITIAVSASAPKRALAPWLLDRGADVFHVCYCF